MQCPYGFPWTFQKIAQRRAEVQTTMSFTLNQDLPMLFPDFRMTLVYNSPSYPWKTCPLVV